MYSVTVSAVESWNKIKKQLKHAEKIKTFVSNFYLNHVINFIYHAKIYMTLVVPMNIQSNCFNY